MKVVWQSCSIVWRSCSVVWRSCSVAFSRVGERGKKLIQPSYVLTRFNTTFIRLSYHSHTPEHEIHTFVIRPEEPITWLSENVGNPLKVKAHSTAMPNLRWPKRKLLQAKPSKGKHPSPPTMDEHPPGTQGQDEPAETSEPPPKSPTTTKTTTETDIQPSQQPSEQEDSPFNIPSPSPPPSSPSEDISHQSTKCCCNAAYILHDPRDQNKQKYVVWRSCSVVWRSCLSL